jgi:membrane protein implicated in regulation of membrane protease activity
MSSSPMLRESLFHESSANKITLAILYTIYEIIMKNFLSVALKIAAMWIDLMFCIQVFQMAVQLGTVCMSERNNRQIY